MILWQTGNDKMQHFIQSDTGLIKNQVRIMLYFSSKMQDDSYRIIAPISCIMASFHKLNQTDIIGCVHITDIAFF